MKSTKLCIVSLLVFSVLTFTGYTMMGPDYQAPETELPESWTEPEGLTVNRLSDQEKFDLWSQFNDPLLDRLNQAVYQHNLSLRTAGFL